MFNAQSDISNEAISLRMSESYRDGSKKIVKVKTVQMIDPVTNNTIRLFKSLTDTIATFELKSNNKISLCCQNNIDEYAGFKWQFYDGPLDPERCE